MRKRLLSLAKKHWEILLLLILLSVGFFFRLYGMETYSQFTWDQVDNAWAAKTILVDHKILLTGMVAKGNSGIYIGPLYYYVISIFYFFTHLDPVASIIFAAVTSVFSAIVVFFVTKKIFSIQIAFIALFIQTISFAAITFDRIQWPVDFIPAVSLLILYFLYRVITGNEKSLLWLGILTGLAFHTHFTAIYFPIIILLSLPFFPRTRKTIVFGLLGFGALLIFLIPSILIFFQNKSYGSTLLQYGSTSYHGIHLRRILQLSGDAFIQFTPFLHFKPLFFLKILFLPIFATLYLLANRTKKTFFLFYLFGLWFIIPWVVLSAYSGELSDYYFLSTRFVALIIISYIVSYIFFIKRGLFIKTVGMAIVLFYAYINLSYYVSYPTNKPLSLDRRNVLKAIHQKRIVQFREGDSESYLYYFYTKH